MKILSHNAGLFALIPLSRKTNFFLAALSLALLSMGCYTTQSFNHGKLADPGDAVFTLAAGSFHRDANAMVFSDGVWDDSTSEWIEYYDTVAFNWLSISLGYRLGVHEKYPFGGGLEIGVMVEGSFFFTKYWDSWENDSVTSVSSDIPPAIEFDLRMGFKPIPLRKGTYNHNVSLGWDVGAWVDNGWFIEYAGGWEFAKYIPYIGMRFFMTATDVSKLNYGTESKKFFNEHHRSYNIRNVAGCSLRFKKIPVLPDIIAPEVSVIYPDFSFANKIGFTYHIGFRWMSGF